MTLQVVSDDAELLRAEVERLAARIERRNQQNRKDRGAIVDAEARLRRLAIVDIVGVPGAVRVRCRGRFSDWRVNDAAGTVKSVCRTRCVVDWGAPLGQWRMLIDDLLPVAAAATRQMDLGKGGSS